MITVDYKKRIGELYITSNSGKRFIIPIYGGKNIFCATVAEYQVGNKKTRNLLLYYVDEEHLAKTFLQTQDVFGYRDIPNGKLTKVRLNTWFREYEIIALYYTIMKVPVSLYRKPMKIRSNNIPLGYESTNIII